MKRLLPWTLAAFVALTVAAAADLSVKDGGGTTRTIFNYVCFTTKLCNATVLINSAGGEVGTSSAPVRVDPTGTTPQPVSGDFATSVKQSDGSHKTQIVDGSGNVIAATSNNLNVQCANCSGSGVSTADAASFTASTSLFAGTGGFFQTTATANALTNGQQGMWQMTSNRAGFVNLRDTAGTAIGTSAAEVFVGGRGTAGSAAGGVLTVQGSASGTAIPVSLASVPSHAVTNAGTFATQSNGFTSWAGGTLGAMATYGTSPGAVNVPGVNAFVTNTLAAGQAVMASSSPVVIASNQSAIPVTMTSTTITGTVAATQSGTWTVQPGNTANTTAWLVRPNDGTRSAIVDPCEATLQSYAPISITTATTTRIVAPSASNKTYICHLFLTSAAADNVGIVEGTGGTCGSGTAGVIGGTTAANGPNFAANGGVALHAGGKVAVAQTAGTNVDLCLITSAATPLAGGIKYVQAP